MSIKHTKGPWELNSAIEEDGTLDVPEHERYVIGADNVLVADCYADTHLDFGLPGSYQEAISNARLIAAAPELLDALKEAHAHLNYCGYGDRWERECAQESKLEEQILKAIAKAEGTNEAHA